MSGLLLNIEKRPLSWLTLCGVGLASKSALNRRSRSLRWTSGHTPLGSNLSRFPTNPDRDRLPRSAREITDATAGVYSRLSSAAAWPVVARAQQPAMPVIGWLNVRTASGTMDRYLPAFNQGLAETGYVVGRNVTIESRESVDQLPALAADLVRRRVTVIVAVGLGPTQVAKAATRTIPVDFGMDFDPVESGVVASLSRPSGNLTGVPSVGTEVAGKRFESLHKLVLAADPIAYLSLLGGDASPERANLQTAARILGVRLLPLVAATESDVAAAFAAIVERQAGALLIASGANSVSDQVISLAGRYAVPTLFLTRDRVVSGGLVSYGPPSSDALRQVGVYTGRILKREKPSDLPVVQPTKFEFVINLKTAKALGLTIAETLRATADEVIE
jgi:putative tryptophan/tyrosine transport system substrate-binding protein